MSQLGRLMTSDATQVGLNGFVIKRMQLTVLKICAEDVLSCLDSLEYK